MLVEGHSGRSVLAKNSIFNLLGQLTPMLIGVVTVPVIVRGLGTDGYGILSIAFMVLGYFSIFDLGLSRATVKFVAEHLNPLDISKVPGIVWTSLGLLFALGCVGGSIGAAFAPLLVTHYLKMPHSFLKEAEVSLFILCASMPVMLTNDALRGVLEATQRFDLVNYVKVPGSICFYLSAAIGAALGIKVSGLVLLLVLVRLSTSFVYLGLCFRIIPDLRLNIRFSRDAITPLATFGGWVMVSNITGPIFATLERFIIAGVLSVGMLAYYSVPFDVVTKVLIVPASIAPTLFPYFSYHGNHREEVSAASLDSMKYLLLLMTPMTVVFCAFSKDILHLWMGVEFAERGSVVMQVMALTCFLNAFAYIPYTSVQALGRPDLKAKLDLVALPTYAACAWWLSGHYGINGAAVAKLLVTVVDCACLYLIASKMRAFSPKAFFKGTPVRAQAISLVLAFTVLFLSLFHLSLSIRSSIVGVLVAAYAITFWAIAVRSNERHAFRNLFRQLIFAMRHEPVKSIV